MFANYIKIAMRNILRHKLYSAVNILGLALGISCSLMIAVLITFELGFDMHHPKGERLYRIVTDELRANGRLTQSGGSPGAIAEALLKDVSDVEQATLVFVDGGGLFTVKQDDQEKKFELESGIVRATPEFFEMFDIQFLHGSAEGLKEPGTVVLAQSVAERFFGSGSAVGKTLRLNNSSDLRVVGVVSDPPQQTHLNYTVLSTGSELKKTDDWLIKLNNLTTNAQTYVLLREGATAIEVEKQMGRFKELYLKDAVDQKTFFLQPVRQIHLDPSYAGGIGRVASRDSLLALGIIALFLILTACVNFINMATAQAATRAREVGVRKVLGAIPNQIGLQFLIETFLVVATSLAISLIIAGDVLPLLGSKIGIPLNLNMSDPVIIGFLVALTLLMTLLSGFYPSIVLKSFSPVSALKGKVSSGGLFLRKGLIVLQFAISQVMLVGLLIVAMQMEYLSGQDMGMDSEGVVVVPIPVQETSRAQTLRNELASRPQVRSVSFSWSSAISGNVWDTNIRYYDNEQEKILTTDLKFADDQYLDTYGLTLVAGRNLMPGDTVREFIVNETFIRHMGIHNASDAIGTMIKLGSREPKPIVGVVRDFNIASLHEQIRPCVLATRSSAYYEAAVRIQTSDMEETLQHLERAWTTVYPEFLYSYEFLDERIASFYEQERRVEFLFSVSSGIAILIGSIGLVGLISFIAAQKTKEIGVRKVLGASVSGIVGLLSKDFVKLVVVANIVAWPLAYYAMSAWLENFAYRIDIDWTVFALAGGAALAIALLTVSFQAIRAALRNPVEALRYE